MANYAEGWAADAAGNWWRLGDFAGTVSEIERTSGRFCWTILANARDDAYLDAMRDAIDSLG